MFSPKLRKDDTGLNCFAKPNFVCEDCPFRKRRLESKESGIDLMRSQIYLCIL